jgi:hypothetical protein
MVSKWIASLVGVAMMATSVAAQEYPDDDYVQQNNSMAVVRGTCTRAAQQAVQMTGGELLSVRPARNGRPICAVTVLVINAKGRPRKVRLRIPMDF